MEEKKSPPYYAAVVVINTDGKVLLGKRKEDGIWTTPGGGAEPGEMNPPKTAARELFEEAGIPADVRFLQPLEQIATRNGKICHTFLYVVSNGQQTTSKLDPDQEVKNWKWFAMADLPAALINDERRHASVRAGYMKYYDVQKSLTENLEKGGRPADIGEVRTFGGKQYQKMGNGDWKPVVHPEEKQLEAEQNKKVVSLTSKLKEKIAEKNEISAPEKHLHDLKNQSVVPNEKTRNEHPVFTNVEAALAHGYESQDFREVGNFFYDRAQKMAEQIQRLEHAKQKVEPALEKIKKENARIGRAFLSQANHIEDRQKKSKMAKSTVAMGHNDAAEINTADYAIDRANSIQSEWLGKVSSIMDGYIYGEEPRVVVMDQGDLYLVKVDDGLYSGLFKKISEDGQLIDNAKVRIERMTLPSLIQFCMAKEWISSFKELPPVVQHGIAYGAEMDHMAGQIAQQEKDAELKVLQNFMAQKLSHVDPCPGCEVCQPAPSFKDSASIEQRIRMLELINKLVN